MTESDMMNQINLVIVGCGYVAEGHLTAWKKIPEATILAVVDLNQELAKQTAQRWGIRNYYSTLKEAMANNQVNLVDIATPPQVHSKVAVEAMNAGANVLIEKPMTMTVSDSQEIVDCWKETGVKAAVLHNWLFDQSVVFARSLVKEGGLGEVFNASIEALSTKEDSMAANKNHWCHKFPGGRFSEMLAHPIYLVREFLGTDFAVDDIEVSKIGDYPWMKSDELVATFRVGRNKLGRAYASFNSSRDAIFVFLYGTEGILKLDIINSTVNFLPKRITSRFSRGFDSLRQAGQLVKWTAKNAGEVVFKRWQSGHDLYIKEFAEYLRKGGEPPVSIEEGLSVIKNLDEMCKIIELKQQKAD
jgi:predicted dehydrogenase